MVYIHRQIIPEQDRFVARRSLKVDNECTTKYNREVEGVQHTYGVGLHIYHAKTFDLCNGSTVDDNKRGGWCCRYTVPSPVSKVHPIEQCTCRILASPSKKSSSI